MTFAVRVRQARRFASLSQAGLAARVGVARSAVAQWERRCGGSRPTGTNLAKIALTTGVNYEWLATARGKMLPHAEGNETATLVLNFYAHDELEERLLTAFRGVPYRERQPFVEFIEAVRQRL